MSAPESRVWAPSCFAASAVVLGQALQVKDGFYDDRALVLMTAALALCVTGVVALGRRWPAFPKEEPTLRMLLAAGLAWQVITLLAAAPGMYLEPGASLALFRAGVIAEAACLVIAVVGSGAPARAAFPALLVVHFLIGTWMLRASPDPPIDVVTVHREALNALARGQSPYQISFQNIYGAGTGFYSPSAQVGDRVMFGYPYPPLSLLLAAPGHFLAGDYRYAELVAWIGSAALIGYARPSIVATLASALLLTQPRGWFVLEQGWTEPIALLMLALTVFAMLRRPALAGWAGGLLVATKQYLVLAGPLLWRFAARRRNTWGFLARAACIAAAVTVPFLLWQPRSFIESVLLLQTREPFRIDSLSYLSWAARHGWGAGSFLWAIVAAAAALVAGIALTPNTAGGFAAALALSSFVSFAFGSKAFCNYYFFVAGALCCATAVLGTREDADSTRHQA